MVITDSCITALNVTHLSPWCRFGSMQSSWNVCLWHVGFANEGQFLLMNSASLADVNTRIAAQASKQMAANIHKKTAWKGMDEVSRFRPNLLVGGPGIDPYAEDAWQELQIGTNCFFTAGVDASMYMCMYSGAQAIVYTHHLGDVNIANAQVVYMYLVTETVAHLACHLYMCIMD